MRIALVSLFAAGCGLLEGPNDDTPIATLRITATGNDSGEATNDPSNGIVWYAGPKTVLRANGPLRTDPHTLASYEVDVTTLPPDEVLVTTGTRRAAIGQLVFYTENEEDAGVTGGTLASSLLYGAPIGALLAYLEGPTVTVDAPGRLLFAGERPGFNWLRVTGGACDAGICCASPVVVPLSTRLDFSVLGPADMGSIPFVPLCPVPASVPSCAAPASPLFPTCP